MRTVRLTIQYDGTGYNGWQVQPNGITLQGMLQEKIKEITGEDAKVTGAGRTDAGVHALGQVAAFKTGSKLTPDTIKRALNAVLPDAVRVMDTCDAMDTFHPRYDAKSKIYFYVIANARIISPFLYRYAWRIPHRLDLDGMSRALAPLEGTHDFSAFRASGCGAKSPVRTISGISMEKLSGLDFMGSKLDGSFIKISIEADAFLRHMVRNIVGTAVEAGKGKITPMDMERILESRDRKLAGPTAPARGLFLERVNY
jgi:tRNA pseudouridine38-40 synthase